MGKQAAKKISSETVETLFGIPKFDLVPIIEQAVQVGPVTSLEIRIEHQNTGSGMSSETLIPTFAYQTAFGVAGEMLMFVKRQLHVENQEAPHYLAAEKADIPTPTYYGRRIGSSGEELLFLEFLPECGIDTQNELEVRELVALLARINTAPLRCTEFKILGPVSRAQQVQEMWGYAEQQLIPKLQQIWNSAAAGEVGIENQKLIDKNPQGVELLKAYAFRLAERMASVPKDALIQGDTGSHQMGWRMTAAGKQLVVFDLHWKVGRRFYDIGYILHNYLGDSALSKEEIAAHYLAEYERWGGEAASLQDFLEITRWFSDEDKLWSCPWLWETALKQISGDDPLVEATGNDFPLWLCKYLTELLDAAQKNRIYAVDMYCPPWEGFREG